VRASTALVALLAAFLLAGCGGSQVSADEVPGAPPELAVPDAEAAGALQDSGSSSASRRDRGSDTTSTSTDATPSDGSSDGTSGDSGGSASSGSSDATGGAAAPAPQATATPAPTQAPAAPQDGAQNDSSPPVDSGAERFEDFCQQNPGAC